MENIGKWADKVRRSSYTEATITPAEPDLGIERTPARYSQCLSLDDSYANSCIRISQDFQCQRVLNRLGLKPQWTKLLVERDSKVHHTYDIVPSSSLVLQLSLQRSETICCKPTS